MAATLDAPTRYLLMTFSTNQNLKKLANLKHDSAEAVALINHRYNHDLIPILMFMDGDDPTTFLRFIDSDQFSLPPDININLLIQYIGGVQVVKIFTQATESQIFDYLSEVDVIDTENLLKSLESRKDLLIKVVSYISRLPVGS